MARLERTERPVGVLLEQLSRGELGLPEIQRSYVWYRTQARDLVDSLYRDYPTGLILLWKPEELPVLRRGEFQSPGVDAPQFLILDGQQRLTSLKRIFDGDIEVCFHVEQEAFQIYSARLKADPCWVSVRRLIDQGMFRVLEEIEDRTGGLSREKRRLYGERLTRLERIKDHLYPVMILHTDDYEEVTESFIRINSRGTRLREAELAMAHLAFAWPGAIVEEFKVALEEYELQGFNLEARFLMRCYVALGTHQSRFRHIGSLWKLSEEQLKRIWAKTRFAVDHALSFLKSLGLETSDWIPSVNALVPLVVYLDIKQGRLSDSAVRTLTFWFFVATVQGRFTGSSETKLDQDIRAITKGTEPLRDLVSNLRKDVGKFDVTADMLEGRYSANPSLPLLLTVFRAKGARDWFTGTELSSANVGPQHQLEFHHIFPRSVLKGLGRYTREQIDDIANIALLSEKANRSIANTPPEQYLSSIEATRLQAQCVPEDPDLWKVGSFQEFLLKRRHLLAEAANAFLRSHASQAGLPAPC